MNDAHWIPWVAGIAGAIAVIAVLFLLRWIAQGRRFRSTTRMDGKVVIITGANTGIGKANAIDLAKRGAKVYMACRDKHRGEVARDEVILKSGNSNVIFLQLDLASLQSVRAFVAAFLATEQRLDVLINNAGVFPKNRSTTLDGFEMQIGVNHMGHFLLTNLLLDILKASAPSRIVTVSSALHYMGNIKKDDLNTEKTNYSVWGNYAQSKLANVLFTRSLSQRLAGTGVTANTLHPGSVKTDIERHLTWEAFLFSLIHFFYRTPKAGAQTQIRLAVDPELEKDTGKYFDDCRQKEESDKAKDDEMAEWLWATSEIWTKLRN